jgi:hypothetical protein
MHDGQFAFAPLGMVDFGQFAVAERARVGGLGGWHIDFERVFANRAIDDFAHHVAGNSNGLSTVRALVRKIVTHNGLLWSSSIFPENQRCNCDAESSVTLLGTRLGRLGENHESPGAA